MTPVQIALTGLELKEQGQQSLERHGWLSIARKAAEWYCRRHGTVTTDDVHHFMMGDPPHPNCYGAIFHDKRFVATGERVRSTRPEAHGRWIEVWRLA
jgi:hypothetical protein